MSPTIGTPGGGIPFPEGQVPEAGLHGNTHFPMSDLNNREVAELMYGWLHEKGLD